MKNNFKKSREEPSISSIKSEINSDIDLNKLNNSNSQNSLKMQPDCKNEMPENSFSKF